MTEIDPIYKILGERMKTARRLNGFSQGIIAEAVGLSRPSIANIEIGRQRVALCKFLKICEVLGINASEIIDSDEAQPHDVIAALNSRMAVMQIHINKIKSVVNEPIFRKQSNE